MQFLGNIDVGLAQPLQLLDAFGGRFPQGLQLGRMALKQLAGAECHRTSCLAAIFLRLIIHCLIYPEKHNSDPVPTTHHNLLSQHELRQFESNS